MSSVELEHPRSRLGDASPTERVTYREHQATLERLDDLVDSGEYASRSQAIRDAVRQLVGESDCE